MTQIVEEDGSLVEIGPRFCLNLVKIFDGPFSGAVIYTNPHYVAPNKMRRLAQKENKYMERKEQKVKLTHNLSQNHIKYYLWVFFDERCLNKED